MKNFNTDEFLKSLEPLYLQGRFEEAIKQLAHHEPQLDAWVYHFNIGTLYGNQGVYGAGRYHLEKALSYPGERSLVESNLQFILDKLGPIDASLNLTRFESVAIYLHGFPVQYSIILTLIILLIVTVLWKVKMFKKWYTYVFLISLTILPVAIDQLWVKSYQVAIVLENTQVRVGPSEIFEEKGSLMAGAKLLLKKSSSGQWLQILKPERSVGWIRSEDIGQL